ncbi:hypothetical protein NQ318_023514 [Aromia moschata]|uniref:DDE-1 domain-containing protein n=1 Tax=Aromia moschata TaxID=1265417 RepID=A0AAV8YR26_9CUCU|nr:hypothetical protein NQ318_023514 [Aromia moschata]
MKIGRKVVQLVQNSSASGASVPVGASGWFDMNLFETWFFSILLPHVEATREAGDTVVLLGDNLASHFSPKVIEACRTSKIYLSPFPANATHLMQPLDVAVFAPMKRNKWRRESRYPGCIPKEKFPVLLGRLWSGISDSVSQNLVSCFRAIGLHPPNPAEVLKRIPDGLDDVGEVVERNIDASLRELLQEHRGSGEKQKRKRGKKIEPGTNASAVNIEETELNVEEAQPNEEAGSETATIISVSINQNKPSISASENIIKQRPVRETRKPKRVDSSICGICRINWKHDRGKVEWIQCLKCSSCICGQCNGASTNPYYNCPRCEDTDDEEVDDSEEDKDFVPSD